MSTFAKISVRSLAAALVLTLAVPLAFAGRASNSRPGGGSSGASGSVTATRGGGGSSGGSKTVASGHATWRHGGSGGGYYPPGGGWWGWPYYPHYPYWGWYGGWYGAWSGPAWYYGPARTVWIAADPARLPAVIETGVTPRKARVLLDGQDVGRAKDFNGTWDQLRVAPGRHTLEFALAGYQTLRVDLDARGGEAYRVDRKLTKGEGTDPSSVVLAAPPPPPARNEAIALAPARETAPPATALRRGLLRIAVEPADAAVYLDGEFLARGDELASLHGALPVAAGTHRIEVVRPGHASRTLDVEVREGSTERVEIRLQPR